MRTRTLTLATTGLLAAAAVGYGAAVALDDPDRSVDAMQLEGITVATSPTTSIAGTHTADTDTTGSPTATLPEAQQVAALESLSGELRAGDDADDWSVAGVEVDFGPDGWLHTAPEIADFDGDGTTEPVLEELAGLEGERVALGVRYELDDDDDADDDERDARDDADVFTIQGMTFRDPAGGAAPWHVDAGASIDRDAVTQSAEAAVGDGARAVEVERGDEGWDGWEVEVMGGDGREYRVLVGPAGDVLDVRIDD
jgi:hypothetical protein